MLKLILSGCSGHMGRVLCDLCSNDPALEVIAGFDILGQSDQFPIFSNPAQCDLTADAVIDFSHPAALDGLLVYAQQHRVPLVLATTGYSQQQLEQIDEAAKIIPIFRSANMSLGINVMVSLLKQAASSLGNGYDVEIIERHHRRKLDAPSGTALMLADAVASALPHESHRIYDRHSVRKPREKQEIGISAVRGGTIVGDHTVLFAGWDEVIEISHHAASRDIFANGALAAAKFLSSVSSPGLYDMSMLVESM